jgi:hypothetical protein
LDIFLKEFFFFHSHILFRNNQNFANIHSPQNLRELEQHSLHKDLRMKNLIDFNQSLAKIADNRSSTRSNSDLTTFSNKTLPKTFQIDPRMKVKVSPSIKDLASCRNLLQRLNDDRVTPCSVVRVLHPQGPSTNLNFQTKPEERFRQPQERPRAKQEVASELEALNSFGSSTTDYLEALTTKNPSQSQEFFRNLAMKSCGTPGKIIEGKNAGQQGFRLLPTTVTDMETEFAFGEKARNL